MTFDLKNWRKRTQNLENENTKLHQELVYYKETEHAKEKPRKRVTIIYTANVKKIQPEESTIKKYGLKQTEKGTYY